MCNQIHILVVTQDHVLRNMVECSLEADGHSAHFVSSLEEGIDASGQGRRLDALLLDAAAEEWDEASARVLIERVGIRRVWRSCGARGYLLANAHGYRMDPAQHPQASDARQS